MAEPSKSVLSREQIRQALAVLREEQQAHPISSAQRKHFFWWKISVAVFFGTSLLFALIRPYMAVDQPWGLYLVLFFSLLMLGTFLSIVLLFFWNLKLIWQTGREFWIAFRTKLWQLVARTSTGRRWLRRLMIGYFGASFVGFLAMLIFFWQEGEWVAVVLGLLFMLVVLAFFFLRFARRRLDVLRNADQLVAFLSKLDTEKTPAGVDKVAIPTDVFKEIGDIEDVHIQRRRELAIAEFRESGQGYAVLKSRAMIADIAKLDEATRLRVETRIAELASESPPPDALCEAGGVWRVPVTETPYELMRMREDNTFDESELRRLEIESQEGRIADAEFGIGERARKRALAVAERKYPPP